MSKEKNKSDIEHIDIPEFKSDIPNHLLNQCDEKEKWMYETLSKVSQQVTWLMEKTQDSNEQIRYTNGKVNKNVEDINNTEQDLKSEINDLKMRNRIFYGKKQIIGLIVGWLVSLIVSGITAIETYLEYLK